MEKFGKYLLIDKIATGGMAELYAVINKAWTWTQPSAIKPAKPCLMILRPAYAIAMTISAIEPLPIG